MLGRLIKAPDQLLHISEAVPAKQMGGNYAVCLSSFINDNGWQLCRLFKFIH